MKTNEVTGRYRWGKFGMAFELGRPGVGARFHDVQRVAQALAALKVEFEENNPVTKPMVDRKKGLINPEVLGEKVLSAIVEFMISAENLPQILAVLDRVSKEINTVFSGGHHHPGGPRRFHPFGQKRSGNEAFHLHQRKE